MMNLKEAIKKHLGKNFNSIRKNISVGGWRYYKNESWYSVNNAFTYVVDSNNGKIIEIVELM